MTVDDRHHFLNLAFTNYIPDIKLGTQIDEVTILETKKPKKTVKRTSFILTLNDIPLTDCIKQNKLYHLPGASKFLEFCSKYLTESVLFEEGSQKEPDSAMALGK